MNALVKPGQLPEPVFEFLGNNQVASSSQVSWSLELLTPSTTPEASPSFLEL